MVKDKYSPVHNILLTLQIDSVNAHHHRTVLGGAMGLDNRGAFVTRKQYNELIRTSNANSSGTYLNIPLLSLLSRMTMSSIRISRSPLSDSGVEL